MNLRNVLAGLTFAIAVSSPAAAGESKTEFTYTESTFMCDSSPSGECQFVLYSSACIEAPVVNGKQSLVCNFSFLQEFTLKVGQSKKLVDLPTGFKQCPVTPGKQSIFPACAK